MTLEIKVLACDKNTNVAELNRLMRHQPCPFDDWITVVIIGDMVVDFCFFVILIFNSV
jgi:hypothetical protein